MSHSKPTTTTFQPSYLLQFPWVKEHVSIKTVAICTWCHKEINIKGMGKTALTSHAKSTKHLLNEKNRTQCLPLQIMFSKKTNVVDNTAPHPTTSSTTTHSLPHTSVSAAESSDVQPITPDTTTRTETQPNKQSVLKKYLFSESITKSEIYWCLQTVVNHIPFAVAARCVKGFKTQFPDSDIASKLKLDYTKVGYVVVFGFGPYFERILETKLKNCPHVVLCFDESLNKVSQRLQMDLHIRWWDSNNSQVKTQYYTSVFLGHSCATDLLEGIKKGIPHELLKKVIQVSMDGPNVNLKLLKDLQEDLSDSPDSPQFLNIGSCGLHTLHNAFKAGMNATKWEIVGFLRAVYNLFKDSPARRSDYTHYTKSLTFPLKFCAVRWIESGRVAERATSILPSVKQYVDSVVRDKKEPGCNSFLVVKEKLNDKLFPAKLAFFRAMCSLYEPFLTEFQTDAPMSPFLYNDLKSLITTLLEKIVTRDHLASVKSKIEKVDLSPKNLIPSNHLDLGFATRDALKKCPPTTDLEKLNLKNDSRNALVAMSRKILDKSPIHYPMAKAITCLDPSIIKNTPTGRKMLDKCLEILVEKKWLSGIKADNVKQQYTRLFSTEQVLNQCKTYKRHEKRLDEFFMDILTQEYPDDYKELKYFLTLILTLSHGNASVERGFSVNKECIVENLREESLVAIRKVCEGVRADGGLDEFEITTQMIHSTKNAHARYTEYLAKKRDENKEKLTFEKNKRQAEKEKAELEAQRQQVLSDARKRAAEIEDKISELSKKCKK